MSHLRICVQIDLADQFLVILVLLFWQCCFRLALFRCLCCFCLAFVDLCNVQQAAAVYCILTAENFYFMALHTMISTIHTCIHIVTVNNKNAVQSVCSLFGWCIKKRVVYSWHGIASILYLWMRGAHKHIITIIMRQLLHSKIDNEILLFEILYLFGEFSSSFPSSILKLQNKKQANSVAHTHTTHKHHSGKFVELKV